MQWVSELSKNAYGTNTDLCMVCGTTEAESPGARYDYAFSSRIAICRVFKDNNGKLSWIYATNKEYKKILKTGKLPQKKHKKSRSLFF